MSKPKRLTYQEYTVQESYFYLLDKSEERLNMIKTLNKLHGIDKERDEKILIDYYEILRSDEFKKVKKLYFKLFE